MGTQLGPRLPVQVGPPKSTCIRGQHCAWGVRWPRGGELGELAPGVEAQGK